MADCKACGAWFGTATPQELCPTCERSMKRLKGYAAPVVRCRECKYRADATEKENYLCNRKMLGLVRPDDFCSFGERKEGEG